MNRMLRAVLGGVLVFGGCAPGGEADAEAGLAGPDAGLAGPDAGRPDFQPAPRLALEPSQFTFTPVVPGRSDSRDVAVHNRGDAPLKLIEFGLSRFDRAQFSLAWWPGDDQAAASEQFPPLLEVEPDGHLVLRLTFTPADRGGGVLGDVRFRTNATPEVAVIPITVSHTSGELHVSPPGLDFGHVLPAATAQAVLTVSNIGLEPLELSAITLEGSPDFSAWIGRVDPIAEPSILTNPDEDGVPGLSSNATFEVRVAYSPSDAQPDDAELLLHSSDPRQGVLRVPLAGNSGAETCLDVQPAMLQFEGTPVGAVVVEPVTLTNRCEGVLQIDDLRLSERSAPNFTVTRTFDLPLGLPTGDDGAAAVEVRFSPDAPDAFGGKLLIERAGEVVEVPIVGRGVAP